MGAVSYHTDDVRQLGDEVNRIVEVRKALEGESLSVIQPNDVTGVLNVTGDRTIGKRSGRTTTTIPISNTIPMKIPVWKRLIMTTKKKLKQKNEIVAIK